MRNLSKYERDMLADGWEMIYGKEGTRFTKSGEIHQPYIAHWYADLIDEVNRKPVYKYSIIGGSNV